MYLRYLIATIFPSLIMGSYIYTYKDAKNWEKHYSTCGGKLQSPAALDANAMPDIYAHDKKPLEFTNTNDLPSKLTMKNTGRTVEIRGDWSGKPPKVTGGPLRRKYVFEKAIFRWAQKKWIEDSNYKPKDEDNISVDMQMHLYFFKENLKSFDKAESQKDGLVVFKLNIVCFDTHPYFKELEKNIYKVRSINSTAPLRPFRLASFASEQIPSYTFYNGSLDYPPCSESVTWFEAAIYINLSKDLVNGFRKIKLEGNDNSNVRPPQPLNNRHVWSLTSKNYLKALSYPQ